MTDTSPAARPQAYIFTLYVTGQSPRSERAIANLRHLCESVLETPYELTVIDVLEQPHLAEQERVFVTPTLVKQVPPPARRVLGDLSDAQGILRGLQVYPAHRGGKTT